MLIIYCEVSWNLVRLPWRGQCSNDRILPQYMNIVIVIVGSGGTSNVMSPVRKEHVDSLNRWLSHYLDSGNATINVLMY